MKGLLLWISKFGRTIWRCLTDLNFYHEVRDERLGKVIGYLAVLISALWLTPLLVAFFVGANLATNSMAAFISNKFPANATFEVKDGTFSDNLERPVVARFEQGGVFVVNTATSTAEFASGDWGLVIGQAGLLQRSASDSPVVATAWPKDLKSNFTREQVLGGIQRAAPFVILVLAVLGLILAALGSALSVACLVAFHAFLLWLLMKLLKRPVRYYETAVLAGYAATLPILARVLLSWGDSGTGTLSTVLYWVLLGLIARDLCKEGRQNLGPKLEEPADH